MKKIVFSLLFGSMLAFGSNAQQEIPCATDEALENLHNQFPQLKEEYEMNQVLHNNLVSPINSQAKATGYIIPVVFHVLHMYGSENISDANVYAVMNRLNEDYNATNPDTSLVIPEFKPIIANSQVEFKLAAIDPFGNCTNGIEHIYSHETFKGETVSKINQWDRSHYMNIWVVDTPNSGGTTPGFLLGYATFPAGTDGSGFWTDGIVLREMTVTGSDRTLTHEAGHYLALPHTFAGTNAGDGDCGDDGIADTPPTDGSFSTCNLALDMCNPPLIENVQNYMDYSSCTHMFTNDQASVMHNTLEGISGQRNILSNDTTLMATGVKDLLLPQDPSNVLTVPLCTPVADFYTPDQILCVGSFASFQDASWNAVIDSREWTFEGGTPATSTTANPNVSWTTSGWKKVTLTVTNAAGSDTRVENSYIYVSPDWPDYTGPTSFNMESNTHLFVVQNIEDNYGKFSVTNGNGYNGSKAFKLQTYKDVSNADAYTEDWFYNFRLGGSVDNLITPSVDLRNTTGITVTFKYAYATNATMSTDITEVLKVYSSRNCGETWTTRKTINNDAIVTAGYASNSDFNPSNNTMWQTASFNYTSTSADNKTRFKFEFEASDLSSNLLIDDINITGTLGLNDDVINNMDIIIYPNPTNGEAINVSYNAQNEATQFILRDLQGKIIAQQTVNQTNGQVNVALENTQNLAVSYYFLEVRTGDSSTTKKVVVL